MTTVFALSSARGRAGVAVVRISGPLAKDLMKDVAGISDPSPRLARLTAFRDPKTGDSLDYFLPGA